MQPVDCPIKKVFRISGPPGARGLGARAPCGPVANPPQHPVTHTASVAVDERSVARRVARAVARSDRWICRRCTGLSRQPD